jgi:hypothetical protein
MHSDFVVFFLFIHRAVRVSGKKFVGLYYFVSVLYGSVYENTSTYYIWWGVCVLMGRAGIHQRVLQKAHSPCLIPLNVFLEV